MWIYIAFNFLAFLHNIPSLWVTIDCTQSITLDAAHVAAMECLGRHISQTPGRATVHTPPPIYTPCPTTRFIGRSTLCHLQKKIPVGVFGWLVRVLLWWLQVKGLRDNKIRLLTYPLIDDAFTHPTCWGCLDMLESYLRIRSVFER